MSDALIHNSESFALEVERRVQSGDCEYLLEACAEIIEEMDCEPEECLSLFNSTLKAKIEAECAKRGMLRDKHHTLDLASFFGG